MCSIDRAKEMITTTTRQSMNYQLFSGSRTFLPPVTDCQIPSSCSDIP